MLVCRKPDHQTGLRGAVLLAEGTYELSSPLRIRTSGVVLRGSGREKTILHKIGYDRGALLYIEGTHDILVKDTFNVSDAKAGEISITVQGAFAALEQSAPHGYLSSFYPGMDRVFGLLLVWWR